MSENKNQLAEIVEGGYCIGCGACAVVAPEHVQIKENKYQQYQAYFDDIPDNQLIKALKVCPFSNEGLNEKGLADELFIQNEGSFSDVIGYYRSLYAGYVSEGDYRSRCTSGGIITWTLIQLLEGNFADHVVHVKKSDMHETLFEYNISSSVGEVLSGAKSRYYPVSIPEVMKYVRENDGRYVFVGLPCFIKAVRKIGFQDEVINARIKFCIGLVCGHLKSKAFADLFAWQAGVAPGDLTDIDFRVGVEGRKASQYGVRVSGKNGVDKVLEAGRCYGTNWGYNFFKYEACDYCDDVFAETADLTVGDAWLPEYSEDFRGTSVIITRNPVINMLINDAKSSGRLCLDVLSEGQVSKSQSGGIRHRRDGLKYRLYLKKKKGLWVPKKRVEPSRRGMSFSRKIVYRYRMYLRQLSSVQWLLAIQGGNFEIFIKGTKFHLWCYKRFLAPLSIQVSNFLSKISRKLGGLR